MARGKHVGVKVKPDTIVVDDDDWRPLKYEKIERRPGIPTRRTLVEYNPHARVHADGLNDHITETLACITYQGDYIYNAVTYHFADGGAIIWKRAYNA